MESILHIKMDGQTHEGKVTYEEGDLLEVVFTEQLDVAPGDQVSCLVKRSDEEMQNIEGVILARSSEHRLIIFHSPTVIEFREQRRRYPRFDVNAKGWIRELGTQKESLIQTDTFIQMSNISLGGLAFTCEKQLPLHEQFALYTDLYDATRPGGFIQARIEILHEKKGKRFVYGCKITDISAKHFHTLRKYLLQRQLEDLNVMTR